MSAKLYLAGKLDFTNIGLTAPDIVISELLNQLPEETNGVICGKIQTYTGPVMSYTKTITSPLASLTFSTTTDKEVDIQHDLGKIGTETHKFECYLYTPEYEKYHYRMFFIRYNISNYPVTVVVEESISKSISVGNDGYIYMCNNREELEELIESILTSKRAIAVMQELIRVNQAKKTSEKTECDIEGE